MNIHPLFDTLDQEESAYWLGFYCADGHMFKNLRQISFVLSSKDVHHLEKLGSVFGKSVSTNLVYDNRTKKHYSSSRLTISNKYICQKILHIGIPQQKTLLLDGKVFESIPNTCKNHFIRGYFDGDGSISKINDSEFRVNFSGNENFIRRLNYEMSVVLSEPEKTIQKGKGDFRITYGNIGRLNKIKEFFYENATVFLERKKDIFDQVPLFRGSSYHKGIYWIKARQCWQARIYKDGKMKTIGSFISEDEAIKAWQEYHLGFDTAAPQLMSDFVN